MTNGDGDFSIRRILVAVDASPASLSVVEAAATLAAGLDAELSGIYVEDVNLLRLAGLPFARELAWSSATELQLDCQRMERVLRGRGAHAQRAVFSITRQLKLRGSLRIVRGQVVQEVLRATADMDLLILGRGETTVKRCGSVALQMAQAAPCSVLLLSEAGLTHQSVMVSFTARERDGRTLQAAARLAGLIGSRLLVVLPSSGDTDNSRRQNEAQRLLGQGSLLVTYQSVINADTRFYQRLLHEEGVGVAVIDGELQDAKTLQSTLDILSCSVLLVR